MRTFYAILVVLLAATRVAGQGSSTITLQSTVLAPAGQDLTLADVASLRGEEAERLGIIRIDLGEITADPAGWRRIDAQALRPLLEESNTNWGVLALRGGPCYVRTIAISPEGDEPSGERAGVAGPTTPGTVRALAERWIAQRFNVPHRDVEVRWTSATDGLLDHATEGLTPYFDDSGLSRTMHMDIVMYDDDAGVVVRGSAKADVRIRRDVAVMTRSVRARQVITQADVRFERRWLDAGDSPAASTAVVDYEAATNLKADDVVGASDVRAAIVIQRNDRVQIRVITPTITLTMLARAREDGRPGEVITFEKIAPTRADRLPFQARVEAPGSAVVVSKGGTL